MVRHAYTPVQNAPYFLGRDALDNPSYVIDEFFQNRHLAEHRQVLWQILSAAITSDVADLYDGSEVGSWVLYFRQLEELIEAVWVINEQGIV